MKLSQKEFYALVQFMEKTYVSSGMNDVQFAALAQKELDLPEGVKSTHIVSARKVLDLPANATVGQNSNSSVSLLTARVVELEKLFNLQQDEIAELKARVAGLQRSYVQLATHTLK